MSSFKGKSINGKPHVPAKLTHVLDADVTYTIRFDKMRKPQREHMLRNLKSGTITGYGPQADELCRMLAVKAPTFVTSSIHRAQARLSPESFETLQAKLLMTNFYITSHGWLQVKNWGRANASDRNRAYQFIQEALINDDVWDVSPEDRAFLDTVIEAIEERRPFTYRIPAGG